MTSKNVVSPVEGNINPTFIESPTIVLEVPEPQVIPRSGYDYPNEWSTGLCDIFSSSDCKFFVLIVVLKLYV